MVAARSSIVFPARFTMMPLAWLKIGVPRLPPAITLVAIPLLDALAGARVPKPRARTDPALAGWVPRGTALFLLRRQARLQQRPMTRQQRRRPIHRTHQLVRPPQEAAT